MDALAPSGGARESTDTRIYKLLPVVEKTHGIS